MSMDHEAREAEIKRLGHEIERHCTEAITGCYFASMGAADAAKSQMYALIKSRPAEYVEQLEKERGLV